MSLASSLRQRLRDRGRISFLHTFRFRRIRFSLVPLALWLCLGFGCPQAPLSGASAGRVVQFALPAAAAEVTLDMFSEQAGVQIVFPLEDVRGVATRAVQGSFAVDEALERMLAGTPLKARRDGRTLAFFVRRETPAARSTAAPSEAQHPTPHTMSPLNRLTALVAGVFFASGSLNAQSVAAPSPAAKPAEDETIVLTPFEVTADTGDQYGTTKSTSVTMFNQDTTKLPISVDVMTSQFMADMAITDMDMLVSYNATGGGWGSVQSGDDALPKQPGDRVANTEIKLRGIGAGGLRRDGLIGSNNSSFNDSFATEGIEILKGPNALLYSGAAGGGTISTVSKQARFNRNSVDLSARIDSYGSRRGELDYNRSFRTGLRLMPEVAIRLALMDQKQQIFRHGFGNKARGEYVQLAFRLPRSTLRIGFKHDEALFWQGWMPSFAYDNTVRQNSTTFGYNLAYTPPVDILGKHKFITDTNYPTLSIPHMWADGASPALLGDHKLAWQTLDAGFLSDYNHNPKDKYLVAKLETRITDHISSLVTVAWDRNPVNMQYTGAGTLLPPGTTANGGLALGNGKLNPEPIRDFTAAGLAAYNQSVTATTTDWTIQQNNNPIFYEQGFNRRAARVGLGAEWTNFNRKLKNQLVLGYDYSEVDTMYYWNAYFMADDNWNIIVDPNWTNPAYTKSTVKQDGGRYRYQNDWMVVGNQRASFRRLNTLKVDRFTTPSGQNWVRASQNPEGWFPRTPDNPHGIKLASTNGGSMRGDEYAYISDGAYFAALQTDWFDDRVQTLASVRKDRFYVDKWDYVTPVDNIRKDNFNAYSFGANVRINYNLRAYATLSRSAVPPNTNALNDPMGMPLPVEKSTGWETGFKFSVLNNRIDGSFSYYSVETLGKNTGASTTGSINPNGLNGTAQIVGANSWAAVDQTSKGMELVLSGKLTRGWRTAFRASTADGRILKSLLYPQYYNDQFHEANGIVTYRDGTPVYVNPNATSPQAIDPSNPLATPLTVAMLNDRNNATYYWDPHAQNGTTQNTNLGNLLKGTGGGSNNANYGTPVHGPIITSIVGLPASARQIAWDDPFGNAANGVAVAIKGRYTIGYPRYKFSLTNTYEVQSGMLKGLSIGGQFNLNLQQRNRYISWPTKYALITTTTNPNGTRSQTFETLTAPPAALASNQTLRIIQTSAASAATGADLEAAAKSANLDLPGRWYYTDSGLLWGMPDNYTLDGWLSYRTRLGKSRYTYTVQLNVFNVFNHAPLIRNPASGTNIFGEWRGFIMMNQPRSWAWTNRISF